MSENTGKCRYWAGVCYLENMRPDWRDSIGDILQLPFSYVVHDQDRDKSGKLRKAHLDLIIAWPNNTTYHAALSVFQRLTADGKPPCINKCERIAGIRNRYNYQIHDTDDCRKKGKHRYNDADRITGNGFDIGNYEQLSSADKNKMARELAMVIAENNYTNFMDFFQYVVSNYDEDYFEILRINNGFFERLTKANYLKERQ